MTARAVKTLAMSLGFDACGIARAGAVDEEAVARYDRWIAEGRHDTMEWAVRWRDVRNDPRLLLEGARSLIVVALNYYPARFQPPEAPQVAAYAYGRDYHKVLRRMVKPLVRALEAEGHAARVCVDSAPLRERYWAQRAGLGFVGRNNQLIIPGRGAYFFLGTIVTTALLDTDEPCRLQCPEGCHRCEEACPAHALHEGEAVDARRCLSCLTIEHRGPLPPGTAAVLGNRVFGCDECLKACPMNRHATATTVSEFAPGDALLSLTSDTLVALDEARFDALFGHTPLRRAGLAALRRNLGL